MGAWQSWPALRNLAATSWRATASTSASSNTITGEWPPSSSVRRLRPGAARRARPCPTATEPVKETLRITSEAMRCEDTKDGTPKTRLMTPSGAPASMKHATIFATEAGVSSGGLRMQEQPAASAPPSLRAARITGTFQGDMSRQGPTGSLRTS